MVFGTRGGTLFEPGLRVLYRYLSVIRHVHLREFVAFAKKLSIFLAAGFFQFGNWVFCAAGR